MKKEQKNNNHLLAIFKPKQTKNSVHQLRASSDRATGDKVKISFQLDCWCVKPTAEIYMNLSQIILG